MRGIVLLALTIGIIALGINLLIAYYRSQQEKKRWENSIEGKITNQIDYCEKQITQNTQEIKEIESSINELQSKLKSTKDLPATTTSQTKSMIQAFQQQKDLRTTKLRFFQSAIQKLNMILSNHNLQTVLNQKQQTLKKLKETNYDSLADFEEIKSNLDYQKGYVESIDKLALRMLETENLSNAESLHLELKKMTKELRK